ncbi:MAG: fasciclin domain-containing protein [Bacteroidota bacterium]
MRLSLILLAAVLAAPQVLAQETAEEAEPAGATLIAALEADGRFTTLLGALQATNLTETLQGAGPFTLFAPTDDAFAALPAGTVEGLSPEQLQGVLLYHVVGGAVDSGTASGAGQAPTAFGETTLTFTPTDDGGLAVNDATVIEADVAASNGVIHVIDGVLLPPMDAPDEGMDDGMDGP